MLIVTVMLKDYKVTIIIISGLPARQTFKEMEGFNSIFFCTVYNMKKTYDADPGGVTQERTNQSRAFYGRFLPRKTVYGTKNTLPCSFFF